MPFDEANSAEGCPRLGQSFPDLFASRWLQKKAPKSTGAGNLQQRATRFRVEFAQDRLISNRISLTNSSTHPTVLLKVTAQDDGKFTTGEHHVSTVSGIIH